MPCERLTLSITYHDKCYHDSRSIKEDLMKSNFIKSIMIVLFSVVLIGCGSKEPLSEDVSAQITVDGLTADINEDAGVGTLLTKNIVLNNVAVAITDVTIALSGAGSEDFSVSLEAGTVANSYIGKVSLLHTLAGKGGTTYTLHATATANGQSVGPVPVTVNIIDVPVVDVPKETVVMFCDEVNGTEPWITDATAEGTRPLGNINPDGNSTIMSAPVRIGKQHYFSLDDGTHGATLWESNGTADGTMLVKDINETGTNDEVLNLTVVDDVLYFSAFGNQLWKSDGTETHTIMIKEINASEIRSFASHNSKLYFIAIDDEAHDAAASLWESDGSATGTKFVSAIPDVADKPQGLTFIGDSLYFAMNSDDGVIIIKATAPASDMTFNADKLFSGARLKWMGKFKDKLNIIIFTGAGYALWEKESDSYTKSLDIDFDFGNIQVLDGLYLFNAYAAGESVSMPLFQLWRSDGTEDGSESFKECIDNAPM